MDYTFKQARLNKDEELWLREVYQSQESDVRKIKVKLHGKISNDFDPRKIDFRLFRYDHPTLLGIWAIDPESKVFENVAQVISKIKEMILKSPGIDRIAAADLAGNIGLQTQDVEVALRLMCDLGNFVGSASTNSNSGGYESINLPTGDDGYDAYLSYENLDNLMEEFYTWKPKQVASSGMVGLLNPPFFVGTSSNENVRQRSNTAFVIMPINPNIPELEDVYNAVQEVCQKFGISATRADLIEHQENITDVVLRQIRECEFLIADLSHERPNVYYEVGYAHALGKRPILFRKAGTQLHFDLAGFGCPEFQNVTALKNKLDKRFKAILGIESE